MLFAASDSSTFPTWATLAIALPLGALLGFVGSLVGLVLGNLRLPLVLLLEDSAATAAGTNLGISGMSAAGGAWAHWRRGAVDWRAFRTMAPASIVGAVLGGFFSQRVPQAGLLIFVSCLLVHTGRGTWRLASASRRQSPESARGAGRPTSSTSMSRAGRALREASIGLVVGGLGGLVGLLLGTLRLPAMLRFLDIEPRRAIGTNITVGLVTGISGVVGHLLAGGVNWGLMGSMGVVSAAGAYCGGRFTGRLSIPALLTVLAVILWVVAGAVGWQAAHKL